MDIKTASSEILLVEDDIFYATLCKRSLEGKGFSVFWAKDGEEGLRMLKERKPDLVILDVLMPKVGGFEVLMGIRENPELAAMPVIMLTNLYRKIDVEKAKIFKADAYLVKVMTSMSELAAKINEVLKR